jgi:histidine triad (HIT) family protein
MATLFEKICQGEIPADIVYQDDHCVCFRDIAPQAPTHLLLVPRKPIPRIGEATADDKELLGHMLLQVSHIARSVGISESGFRVVMNNGRDGGEAVPHLHIHILGGRAMSWPPG